MAKRTTQQIREDEEKLLKNKKKAIDKLNTHLEEINNISEEDMEKVNGFIDTFFKCEIVYKTLYPEMKRLKEQEKVDVRSLTFNIQKFEAALRFFGIIYDHKEMNRMFCAKKSYLTCRDKIVHGFDMESINEVIINYDEMNTTMQSFLTNVRNGEPK